MAGSHRLLRISFILGCLCCVFASCGDPATAPRAPAARANLPTVYSHGCPVGYYGDYPQCFQEYWDDPGFYGLDPCYIDWFSFGCPGYDDGGPPPDDGGGGGGSSQGDLSQAPDGIAQASYDSLNTSEKVLCKANPADCSVYLRDAYTALNWSFQRAGELGLGNNATDNAADAERHALWSAILTLDFRYTHNGINAAAEAAQQWTDAHEDSEWYTSIDAHQSSCMDWANNAAGRSIAMQLQASGNTARMSVIEDAVISADENGDLQDFPFKCWN